MINIISQSLLLGKTTGPKKVVLNLIKGLDKIGYPYVINQRLDSCSRLWIHDDTSALKELGRLPKGVKVLVGPNLYVFPRHVPKDVIINNAVYIHPSKWVAEAWKFFEYTKTELDFWSVGIDTDEFAPDSDGERGRVLIYFKDRFPEELIFCEDMLNSLGIHYSIIRYGAYDEYKYKKELQTSRYVIWIGTSESQGIAFQECLAMGVPILVWDVKNFGHSLYAIQTDYYLPEECNYIKCTSAPYFDKTCGIIILEKEKLKNSIVYMESNFSIFTPREFILENLSLEKCARDFIYLYEKHFGLTYENGFFEKRTRKGSWRNSKIYYKIFFLMKEKMKFIVSKI
jgi:glycosyltransferase involved in cell wall biosynthesis